MTPGNDIPRDRNCLVKTTVFQNKIWVQVQPDYPDGWTNMNNFERLDINRVTAWDELPDAESNEIEWRREAAMNDADERGGR